MKSLFMKLIFLVLITQVVFSASTLTSGVSQSSSVSEGSWKYYKISASSGSTVTVNMTGLSSDVDLYVKKDSQPTLNSYDERPYNGGTESESATVTVNSSTTVYIGVYGYTSGSFTIKATVSGGSSNGGGSSGSGGDSSSGGSSSSSVITLSSGVSQSSSVSEGSWKYYKISASSGSTVTVNMTGLSSDVDLYVKKDSQPTLNSYDERPYNGGTESESATVTVNSSTTVYIGVYGYTSGSFTIKATVSGGSSSGGGSSGGSNGNDSNLFQNSIGSHTNQSSFFMLDKPQSFNWYRGCVPTSMAELFLWLNEHNTFSNSNISSWDWNITTFNWLSPSGNSLVSTTKENVDLFADSFGFPREGGDVLQYGIDYGTVENLLITTLRNAGLRVNTGDSNSWQVVMVDSKSLTIDTIKKQINMGLPFLLAMDATTGIEGLNGDNNRNVPDHSVIAYGYDTQDSDKVYIMLGWKKENLYDRLLLNLHLNDLSTGNNEYAIFITPPNFQDKRKVDRAIAVRMILEGLDFTPSTTLNSSVRNIRDISITSNNLIGWLRTALNNNIVQGYGDTGYFRPHKATNRVEFIKILIKSIKTKYPNIQIGQDNPNFPDMDRTAWYFTYVKDAYNMGIVQGTQEGYLLPAGLVSEYEANIMLNRALNYINSHH